MVAIFACGLKRDARVWQKLKGEIDFDTQIQVAIYDYIRQLVWLNTVDGQEGRNRPKSLLDSMLGRTSEKKSDAVEFDTPESFKEEWERRNNGNYHS